jgi:hypothetical protein
MDVQTLLGKKTEYYDTQICLANNCMAPACKKEKDRERKGFPIAPS